MFNGQWSMVNGQWSMVNGQWSMLNVQWSTLRWSTLRWSIHISDFNSYFSALLRASASLCEPIH